MLPRPPSWCWSARPVRFASVIRLRAGSSESLAASRAKPGPRRRERIHETRSAKPVAQADLSVPWLELYEEIDRLPEQWRRTTGALLLEKPFPEGGRGAARLAGPDSSTATVRGSGPASDATHPPWSLAHDGPAGDVELLLAGFRSPCRPPGWRRRSARHWPP